MRKLLSIEKRIDCDYHIWWPVKLNNGEVSLSDCTLSLEVVNPRGERTLLEHSLTEDGIEASFPASIQKFLGEYTLVLTVVLEDSKTVVDKYAGIILVPYNVMADPTEAENLVSSTITVPSGNIAIGIKGKAFKYEDFTEEQKADLKRPAIEAAEQVQESINRCNEATVSAENAARDANDAAGRANRVAVVVGGLATEFNDNEEVRKANENLRISNENARLSNEVTRQNNETQRRSAEVTRTNSETQRQTNETLRQSNETTRINAERERGARLDEIEKNVKYIELAKRLNPVIHGGVPGSVDVTRIKSEGEFTGPLKVEGKYVGTFAAFIGESTYDEVLNKFSKGYDIIAKYSDDEDYYAFAGFWNGAGFFFIQANLINSTIYCVVLRENGGWNEFTLPVFDDAEKDKTKHITAGNTGTFFNGAVDANLLVAHDGLQIWDEETGETLDIKASLEDDSGHIIMNLSSGSVGENGAIVRGVLTPLAGTDAVNKEYVDRGFSDMGSATEMTFANWED